MACRSLDYSMCGAVEAASASKPVALNHIAIRMTRRPSISVVICAYSEQRREFLRAALNSLGARDPGEIDIVVVIDHCPTLQAAIAAEYPLVRVLANEGLRGLSPARNTGAKLARGEIVAFIDDDAVAGPDWLARLCDHYADPTVIGAGGAVLPAWPAARPAWFPEEFDWVVGCSYRGLPRSTAPVRNLIGCNMSFRRVVFDRIGGFRNDLGRRGDNALGGEETEFCIRALRAFPDSTILYDPDAIVRHHVSPDRTRWRYFWTRCFAEGRSKAQWADNAGRSSSMSTERRYVMRVLPAGIAKGLSDPILRADVHGVTRAGAIVAAFTGTALGYLSERIAGTRKQSASEDNLFRPIKVVQFDLAEPTPPIEAADQANDRMYGGVFCLVRNAGRPLKVVEATSAEAAELTPARLGELVADVLEPPLPASPSAPARPSELPHVRVIVATRDRPAALATCLDSLLAQAYDRFEIVVVDSAPSSSETMELIASRYDTTGKVHYMRETLPGLGRAHNRGLEDVTAPVVAFTDDNVLVDSRWLASLAADFDSEGGVGCVTGAILPAELETRAQVWTEKHGSFTKGFRRKTFDLAEHREPGSLFPFAAGQFGSGANMAFLASALRRIGGFDPALGAGTEARGGDDLAAFFATIQAGFQLIYEPEAIVWHHHRRNEDGMRRQAFGYGVGLGSYLTKIVLDKPTLALSLAGAVPAGLAHMWGSSSGRIQRLPSDYPRQLIWRERLGVLSGPVAYLRSRATARGADRARNEGLKTHRPNVRRPEQETR